MTLPHHTSLSMAPAIGPSWVHLLVMGFALIVLVRSLTRHR
ncbi:hypothetical protein ACIBEA_16015 [Streptomyces sp. NPDC051555]